MIKNVRHSEEPHDRLTHIARAVGAAFEGHIDHQEGDKCIIIVDGPNDVGTMLVGYDTTEEAAAIVFGVLISLHPEAEQLFGSRDDS